MLFIAFYIAAQISISCVQILYCYENTPNLKKITYKPYPIIIVCLLSLFFVCKSVLLWSDMYEEMHHRMKGRDVMHNKIDNFSNKSALSESYYDHGRVNTQIQRWEVLMLMKSPKLVEIHRNCDSV